MQNTLPSCTYTCETLAQFLRRCLRDGEAGVREYRRAFPR